MGDGRMRSSVLDEAAADQAGHEATKLVDVDRG
jgi:hypothetical protein